ncbi:hypothetical protein L0665_04515 [Methanogenium marinum]|uniref:Uncharacterized protein n=1 Tax=Methanogenium marinum TaxID=348610 RepID=A0A9Q4PWW9_9EURY|nr:hypothetical protein [Methanogenium marinum]MDE4907871.1 hypothetical protein [Methanogenium marinum]
MIKHSKILLAGIAVTLCLSALLIFPVGASGINMSTGSAPATDGIADPVQHVMEVLSVFEEQDIDVTEIRATLESGDMVAVHALMGDLCDTNFSDSDDGQHFQSVDDIVDEICAGEYGPGGDRLGERKRVEQVGGHISMFEEQDIDVTALRTAFELGDMAEVRALMADIHDECMSEGTVICCEGGNMTGSGLNSSVCGEGSAK